MLKAFCLHMGLPHTHMMTNIAQPFRAGKNLLFCRLTVRVENHAKPMLTAGLRGGSQSGINKQRL